MAITLDSLLGIKPSVVSRDLRGYSVMLYGDPKSGKTSTAVKFPKHLLLGFEKGWSAIAGVMAIPMNSWTDFKSVIRILKDPKAHEKYETIIIDTVDIAYDLCKKYICQQQEVDDIGDIPYGGGYNLVEKEFDESLRTITINDYGLVLISHAEDKTFTDENGKEYNQIVPTVDKRGRKICTRLCDIIGYSHGVVDEEGNNITRLYMRGTPRYVAGSRFKYTPDSIVLTYENLVKAISEAIDKQAAEDGAGSVVETKNNLYTQKADIAPQLSYDELMSEFQTIVGGLMAKDKALYSPKIVEITSRILGKNKKFSDCTPAQVELMALVLDEIKELAA